MAVVTISRQYGAGGSSVGALVAQKLGAEVLDKELIAAVAARLAMPISEVEEEEERPRSLVERLVRSFSTLEPAMGAGWSAPYPDPLFDPRKEIAELTEQVIREAAATGNVVIVGRGAGFILRDVPGVIRVFLWAPESNRIETVMARFGLGEVEARRKIRETDSNRATYLHRLFGHDWMDPQQYDLMLNTGRVGYEVAAEIILQAVASATAAVASATAAVAPSESAAVGAGQSTSSRV